MRSCARVDDGAGRNRIDGDAVGGEFARQRAGKADKAHFRGRVVDEAGIAGEGARRSRC